jgi:hypothetical protein
VPSASCAAPHNAHRVSLNVSSSSVTSTSVNVRADPQKQRPSGARSTCATKTPGRPFRAFIEMQSEPIFGYCR